MIFLANLIPEDKIREVQNSADIVEIVSEVVLLKRTGKNFVGLCPFHSEKTPSFTVSPDKQIFHCFGCSEGGDVIHFVMKHEGLSFLEAVKKLAGRYGIEIPLRSMTPAQKRRISEREDLFRANQEAADFYHQCLLKGRTGRRAMDYLTHRGITGEMIRNFKLGYAPDGWDILVKFLAKRNISGKVAEKAGLIAHRKSGRGYYDRFRDRIIFPIFNSGRAVIGFGGRVMDDAQPKYLNSPETPIYNKRRSLYGLDRARQACRATGTVYIVEGYFDVLALHQHGFVNTVATLGTALTPDHVQILKGLTGGTGKAVLVFDSDTAGIKAAKRSIEVFDRGHVDAHILVLPAGHDPDSFLNEFGAEAFKDAATGAEGIIPFLLSTAVAEHGLSVQGKVRILSQLTGPLAAVSDPVARSLYIGEIAERLGIDERVVLEKVRGKSSQKIIRDSGENPQENRIERQIVSMMFQFPEAVDEAGRLGALDYFQDETLKAVGREILKQKDRSDVNAGEIIGRLADPDQHRIASALALGDQSWNVQGCILFIKRFVETRRRERDYRLINQRIKAAEQRNDQELLARLLNERHQMAVMSKNRKMALLDAK